MRQLTFKMPSELICDTRLSYSARRVAAALYAHKNALGCTHKSYEQLAQLTSLSPATVRKGVSELAERGYITRRRTYRYSAAKGCVVYGKSEYHCDMSFRHGFTLIPREIFRFGKGELSDSAFSILLYIYRCAGSSKRAFPSIRRISALTGAARSTVCLALRVLKALPLLLVQLCRRANGAFCASSYRLVRVLQRNAKVQVKAAVTSAVRPFAAHIKSRMTVLMGTIVRLGERLRCFWTRGSPKFSKLW